MEKIWHSVIGCVLFWMWRWKTEENRKSKGLGKSAGIEVVSVWVLCNEMHTSYVGNQPHFIGVDWGFSEIKRSNLIAVTSWILCLEK